MAVCPSKTEGADPCNPRLIAALPGNVLDRNLQPRPIERNLRIQAVEVKISGDLPVFQAQDGFDQPGNSGCRLQMSKIRLHRAQYTGRRGWPSVPIYGTDRLNLNRVAERCPGAVGLNVANLPGLEHCVLERRAQHCLLRKTVRGRQNGGSAIVIHRRAANDGSDSIAILKGIGQTFQDQYATAFAGRETVGGSIERLASPVAREHAPFRKDLHFIGKQLQAAGGDNGQAALPRAQALSGQMRRHQGRGTCAVECQAWALDIQQKGKPACGHAVRGTDPGMCSQGGWIAEMKPQIIVAVDGREHSGIRAAKAVRLDSCVPERLPGHL